MLKHTFFDRVKRAHIPKKRRSNLAHNAASTVMARSIIVVRLYRSLLRASRPFTYGTTRFSPKTLTCLLHRTGAVREDDDDDDDDDEEDDPLLSHGLVDPTQHGDSKSQGPPHYNAEASYRKLVLEVVDGSSGNEMKADTLLLVPDRVNPIFLQSIIRREFRRTVACDDEFQMRRDVAFLTLKELNKKLAFVASIEAASAQLGQTNPRSSFDDVHTPQCPPEGVTAAHRVAKSYPDEFFDTAPSTYLKPGTFLLAHPLLAGFFHRAVVCILERPEETQIPPSSTAYSTYGVIVNKPCDTKPMTINDVFKDLTIPAALKDVTAKVGGPVNVSVQIMHMACPSMELGGMVLPELSDHRHSSTIATETNKAVFVRPNLAQIATAIENGDLDKQTDVVFFIGASCWSEGQLEQEINQGFWIPCTGPASLALYPPFKIESDSSLQDTDEPTTTQTGEDLWLSMMMACGQEESELAMLLYGRNLSDANINPCDEVGDDR
jgi:putative AlgH/UPF0301 family transcriptional regulator